MRILFGILAIVSIPFGLLVSFTSYLRQGIGFLGTPVAYIAAALSVIVSIICTALGMIKLSKGNTKQAVA